MYYFQERSDGVDFPNMPDERPWFCLTFPPCPLLLQSYYCGWYKPKDQVAAG